MDNKNNKPTESDRNDGISRRNLLKAGGVGAVVGVLGDKALAGKTAPSGASNRWKAPIWLW